MTGINRELGNILIRHPNKLFRDYYLAEDLSFTFDRSKAARFYLLKSTTDDIRNGDRVTLNVANKTLLITEKGEPALIDRHLIYTPDSFTITTGLDNQDPIDFKTGIYLISDWRMEYALRYDWNIDVDSVNQTLTNVKPKLIHDKLNNEKDLIASRFFLEPYDASPDSIKTPPVNTVNATATDDKYRNLILLFFLIILLGLFVMVTNN